MKERPILFNTPMVKAILEDRKTNTRRVIKKIPEKSKTCLYYPQTGSVKFFNKTPSGIIGISLSDWITCPYGKVGDLLWVRETFCPNYFDDFSPGYKADSNKNSWDDIPEPKWKPSIHMPKKYARIWLKIKNIRVERLQEIDEISAINEGIIKHLGIHARKDFKILWNSINGKPRKDGVDISWNANPYVWVVEFKRVVKKN